MRILPWTRRDIVAASIMALAGSPIVAPLLSVARRNQAEVALLAVLRDRHHAIAIGNAAMASLPSMPSPNELLSSLLQDLRMTADETLRIDTAEIASRLSQRIRDDFATRRTAMLDGWLVSLTEMRLCALAALATV